MTKQAKPKPKLFRYDYVIQAVSALRTYMDSCATDINTGALIWEAHDAIHELEIIEEKINSPLAPRKRKRPMTAALKEFETKAKLLEPVTEGLTEFVTENRAFLAEVKRLHQLTDTLIQTHKQLVWLRGWIERRVAETTSDGGR